MHFGSARMLFVSLCLERDVKSARNQEFVCHQKVVFRSARNALKVHWMFSLHFSFFMRYEYVCRDASICPESCGCSGVFESLERACMSSGCVVYLGNTCLNLDLNL